MNKLNIMMHLGGGMGLIFYVYKCLFYFLGAFFYS